MNFTLNPAQLTIIKSFVDQWKLHTSAKSLLYLRYPDFGVFSAVNFDDSTVISSAKKINTNSKFDLIIGDLPVGMFPVDPEYLEIKLRIPQNWNEIFQSLQFLSEDGTALYLLEPLGFSTVKGIKFEKELNKIGFFISGYFNTPENILQPYTGVTPIIVAITRTPSLKLFVAELLNESQSKEVVDNYFLSKDCIDLKTGTYIEVGSYRGFHRLIVKQQIERLETQYKNYKEFSLGNLAMEINYVNSGGEFQEKDNAIYVPKIGKSPVVSKLSDGKLKHQNYFQVVLRETVLNEYVSAFFKSTLGKLILDSLTSQTFIPHLNKEDLEQSPVALPKYEEQRLIVDTQKSLTRLKSAIDEFDSELALNPASSSSVQILVDTMLDAIGGLTDADKVYGLIREGESKKIEFKETLSLDVIKQTKEKYIETSSLKTVVAFLNTEGGVLLIGVSDEGKISGINNEIDKFYRNLDKFLLHWKTLVKEQIGEEFYPFIDYRIVKVAEKMVLWIECRESQTPCYLDQKDFYVRTNPATDKLEGPKLVEYVKNHFLK